MRTQIIAGNWKLNKTISEALDLAKSLQQELKQCNEAKKFEVVIAPPYTAISKVADLLKDSSIKVSSQNMFWEETGAFTGEISALMLKEAGAKYAIIGHSERRQFFHETDETVNKKIKSALKHGLTPIFCVGETLEEREANKVGEVIATQLLGGLVGITQEEVTKIVIAYEPVWAIGTGKTASPEQAEEVHLMIRQMLAKQFGQENADVISLLYGGSVKASNSKELLSQPNIDGALVGGASLKVEDFVGIIKNAG